jgi:hypothetical protein
LLAPQLHHSATEISVDGQRVRFCQQCAALQPLGDFDREKKSCREALVKHNERRKRRVGGWRGR